MNNKGLLFGGALLAAGLAAQSAHADFSFTYSNVQVGAYGGGDPSYDSFAGAGTWSILADDIGAIATSAGTSETVTLNANSDAGVGAYANLGISYFTVTDDAVGYFSWDFNAGFGLFFIDNVTDLVNLVIVDSGAGAQTVTFEAGKEYLMAGITFATGDMDGKVFSELVIPTPAAALPLLAAGGLMTTRRRRRQ